jgi:hypothetical protein
MIDIISRQIKGVIENSVFNQINSLGLGLSNPITRAVASRAAEELSILVSQSVSLGTNQQLNTIPQNLIGLKNPVNLTTGNLGSAGISNNLGNILNTQLNGQLTDKLVTIIERELRLSLPADKRNLINFAGIAATLTQVLTPTISSTIGTALGGITEAIFGRNQTTPLTLPNASSLFSSFLGGSSGLNFNQLLGQIDGQFASTTATKYLGQAKSFDINNSRNQEKLVTLKQGFIDPEANYPTKEYAGQSEINKLAQGDVRGTIVQTKNSDRVIGAKLPGGEAWDQPESPYKGEYPYNKVTQTESGHIIEMDDTPGAERIHLYHKSGTFVEIDVNGSVVMRTKGSKYEIIDRNGKIAIRGSADISVNGVCNIFVGNDANIEVEGDTNLLCHNDITAQAGGTFNLSAVEEFNISSGNVNIEAYNSMNVKSNVALIVSTTQELSLRSNTNAYVQATTLYQNTTNSHHQTITNIYEKLGGSKFTQTVGAVNYQVGGNFNADTGGEMYLNSGNAVDSQNSKSANVAGPANIGVISGRKDITDNSVDDPITLTLVDPYALRLEEEPAAPGEYAAHKDLILTSGFATSEEFDTTPVALETNSDSSTQSELITPSDDIKKFTALPGNFNLSPNFTVELLSSKAALTKSFIEEDPEGLKYGEIVYNLTAVALNILEPAYNVYPKLFVASGYRSKNLSSQSSMHPQGKCVDVQFQGATKEDYYEYAKQLVKVLNYDQFILHYCNYTNNPWIHISFQGSNNRKQVMTFWNNKKHSDGLSKLV